MSGATVAKRRLLRAAEFAFKLAVIHFDDSGPSVGTGVRHRAAAEVFDQIFQFRSRQRVVGFNSMAADGFGDDEFAEAESVHGLAGRFEFVHKFKNKAARVAGADEGRQRVQKKSAFAKFAEAHAETGEDGQLAAEEIRIAGGQFHSFGKKDALGGGGGVLFEAAHHLLEENAFVGGVLVEENEAPVGFENDVEAANDADKAQRDVQQGGGSRGGQRLWLRTRRERRRRGFQTGRRRRHGGRRGAAGEGFGLLGELREVL